MSHFAKVLNGKVTQVIVAESEFFDTFVDPSPGIWVQTSYNTRGNIHYGPDGKPDGGIALRGNYAGMDYIYDEVHDVFYAPRPYKSWVLNKSTWQWESPVLYPTDGDSYLWNEDTASWVRIEPQTES